MLKWFTEHDLPTKDVNVQNYATIDWFKGKKYRKIPSWENLWCPVKIFP